MVNKGDGPGTRAMQTLFMLGLSQTPPVQPRLCFRISQRGWQLNTHGRNFMLGLFLPLS